MGDEVQKLEEKVQAGEPLTQEETQAFLEDQDPPADYANQPVDLSPEQFDAEPESTVDDKKDAEADPGKVPDPAKKEEKPKEDAAPAADDDNDVFVRLERELSKPEGKEDLKDFTPREKAYFHRMRRDRKRMQKAEADRDAALFNNIELKKKVDTTAPKPEEKKPSVLDQLKQRDPTDFLTAGEVISLIENIQSQEPKDTKPAPTDQPPQQNPQMTRYLNMCDIEARSKHPDDYDAVMELTEDLLTSNPQYLLEVQKSLLAGENPAEKSYELIKADPAFADLLPAAQARIAAMKTGKADKTADEGQPSGSKKDAQQPGKKTPEEEAKEREAAKAQKALEDNQARTKTTAHASSGGDTPADELTMEQISQMSDMDFARLPKKTRDRYLKKYG